MLSLEKQLMKKFNIQIVNVDMTDVPTRFIYGIVLDNAKWVVAEVYLTQKNKIVGHTEELIVDTLDEIIDLMDTNEMVADAIDKNLIFKRRQNGKYVHLDI